mmetsp:Transcript_31984/g.71843  ORF Transcript_31984/g.71843 Transcript_31984/m.71843 type:complete len:165 (+) Transcript_31984:136-630(+)
MEHVLLDGVVLMSRPVPAFVPSLSIPTAEVRLAAHPGTAGNHLGLQRKADGPPAFAGQDAEWSAACRKASPGRLRVARRRQEDRDEVWCCDLQRDEGRQRFYSPRPKGPGPHNLLKRKFHVDLLGEPRPLGGRPGTWQAVRHIGDCDSDDEAGVVPRAPRVLGA